MMTDPNMVFSTDPRHGLVARSGWEQVEARTVLHDLGWVWEEELHALVQPDDVSAVEAGVQAVEELHLHGHRTGFSAGPYGAMPLTPNRVESIITKEVGSDPPGEPTTGTEMTDLYRAPHPPCIYAETVPPQAPNTVGEFDGPGL